MKQAFFPTIDLEATGKNIIRLRKQKGLTVKDLQNWFGFEEPRAIYKWQTGQSLPSIDNLYALSILLDVPIDHILVGTINHVSHEPQAAACGSHYLENTTSYTFSGLPSFLSASRILLNTSWLG